MSWHFNIHFVGTKVLIFVIRLQLTAISKNFTFPIKGKSSQHVLCGNAKVQAYLKSLLKKL